MHIFSGFGEILHIHSNVICIGCDDTAGHQEATQASAVGSKGNLSGQLL